MLGIKIIQSLYNNDLAALDTKKGDAEQLVVDISATTGVEIGRWIKNNVSIDILKKGFTFNFIPNQTPGWWSGQMFADGGSTWWGFYMNRDTNTLYKYVYAGGADSVTPFSGSGNISPNLIGQWVGSNVTRSFSFDSSKSYFIGGADQFNDNNFRSFCAVLVKGTIVPIITNGYFNPSVSGNTCNIWIPSSGSTISLYVVQLN